MVTGGADRLDLGVGRTDGAVKALRDHRLTDGEHGPDQRIGADLAAAPLGELDGPGEVEAVDV